MMKYRRENPLARVREVSMSLVAGLFVCKQRMPDDDCYKPRRPPAPPRKPYAH